MAVCPFASFRLRLRQRPASKTVHVNLVEIYGTEKNEKLTKMPSAKRASRRRWAWTVAVVWLAGTVLSVGLTSISVAGARALYVSDPVSLVNPFIGTANGDNTFPGADVPFGMVQWSPDTTDRPDGGGYLYRSGSIIGYSLTHLSGPGCAAEGDVPVLPTAGVIGTDPAAATEPLIHNDETAAPGYYQLDAGDVNTQLTTTTRSGMASFTFPSAASPGQSPVQAVGQRDQGHGQSVQRGQRQRGRRLGHHGTVLRLLQHLHAALRHGFQPTFRDLGDLGHGRGSGAYVSFDTSSNPVVEAKVGISYVSTANAQQQPDRRGSEAGASTRCSLWPRPRIVAGPSSTRSRWAAAPAVEQTVFYTALYHSLLEPNVFSDVNGQYMGSDGHVQRVAAPQIAQYANYSGWDIYRSEIPLLALMAPTRTRDIDHLHAQHLHPDR